MINEIKEFAFVAKINVSDAERSAKWYTEKLDLEIDKRFLSIKTWRQLKLPNIKRVAIGLDSSELPVVGNKAVLPATTFLVNDIVKARNELINRDVNVQEIINVGEGVSLAFFKDPDGNNLALRHDSKLRENVINI